MTSAPKKGSIFDDSIVELSATNYLADLRRLVSTKCSPPCRDAAIEVARIIKVALKRRVMLRPSDVSDLRPLLQRIPRDERGSLINQSSLGLGSPTAPILIVGQEHAYDVDTLENLALEACGLTVLWLCGGRADIAAKLSGLCATRAFNLHPADYYPEQPSGHTWHYVAKILGASGCDFGQRAHLIEISAHPATTQDQGKPPSEQRLVFLREFSRRTKVKEVLFHGTRWRSKQRALAAAYLGVRRLTLIDAATVASKSGKTRFRIGAQSVGSSRVLFTKMLSGNARPSIKYLAALRKIIGRDAVKR
jgi:hypothetical protein